MIVVVKQFKSTHCGICLLHGTRCCAGTVIRDEAAYAGRMAGLSEEMMISFAETALYALNFSNLVVQGSDMVESTTGKTLWDTWTPNGGRIPGTIQEGQTLEVGCLS